MRLKNFAEYCMFTTTGATLCPVYAFIWVKITFHAYDYCA